MDCWLRVLELSTFRGPTSQEKGFRKSPFAANLERSEVLVPGAVRGLRFRLSPKFQLVEIVRGDLSISQAVEQVITKRGGKIRPLDIRH
jgi:hypothetical protein